MTRKQLPNNLSELAYLIVQDGSIELECESPDGETKADVTIEWFDGKFHVTGEAETVTGWYSATRWEPAEPRGFDYTDLDFESVKIAQVAAHLNGHNLDLGGW